jgi:hypothetical protein
MNAPALPTVRLIVKVRLLEDLHAGSGLGGAGIDALIARDCHGKPVIRWSHLKGMLVEACRERLKDLGRTDDALLRRLFGGEDHTGQDRGLVRGRGLRQPFPGKSPGNSIVWASTARQDDERMPLDDTLRRIEYLAAGTELAGEIRLPGEAGDADLLRKLLLRQSHLGGNRSRGAGLVHITVDQKSIPAVPSAEFPAITINTAAGGTPQWHRLRVVFQALEPVCLAATGQPGNLIPTHSHIASTTVAGMLTRWALGNGLGNLADALLAQHIVCTPAYPIPASSITDIPLAATRLDAVPIPLSYQSPKPPGQDSSLPWWAEDVREREMLDTLPGEPAEKLKRPGTHDYLQTSDGGKTWQLFTCPIGTAMRNNTGASQQRGSKQDLFAVEEIAEETGFVAHLLVRDEALPIAGAMLDELKNRQRWLAVGRGGTPLAVVAWQELTASDMTRAMASSTDGGDRLRLFVDSDLILRAADFRFHTLLETSAVRALLADAGVAHESAERVTVKRQISEPITVHGWNMASGGARLPALAIRRGSVARLDCGDAETASICRAALAFATLGLGERTLEGFGQLRVDFVPSLGDAVEPTNGADAPQPSKRENTTQPSENEHETRLKTIEKHMRARGFPESFAASRWQALSRVAASSKLAEWFRQAERQLGKEGKNDDGSNWLHRLQNSDTPFLQAFGVVAAKAAQARERQKQEKGK